MDDDIYRDAPESESKMRGLVKSLILVCVGMAVGACALAIPLVVLANNGNDESQVVEPAYVKFGEAVASLGGEANANRYIGINLTFQVDEDEAADIQLKIDTRRAVLMTWLLGHLSDKGIDDVRGAAGQNRLRREIQDEFNDLLFDDHVDRIRDVLFEEFKIQ